MTPSRRLLLNALIAAAAAAGTLSDAVAATPQPGAASSASAEAPLFEFAGKPFVHRWSKNGQNEFTPPGQPDLDKWRDMVTIQVYKGMGSAEQLALVANAVLSAYQKAGLIIRSSSSKAQPGMPAEHMVVAVLSDKGLRELVFARFRLTQGAGEALIYSHRVYGMQPDNEATAWMRVNDQAAEKAMMSWTTMPSLEALRALPQDQ